MDKYVREKVLGKGSYGAALLVRVRDSSPPKRCVLKEIVVGHMSAEQLDATKREAQLLAQMSHSNIVEYFESFVENDRLYIVMDYADGGDLSGAIKRQRKANRRFPERTALIFFVQICMALKHIHAHNIIHRDIKSQNIFLTRNGVVKLGDFGIAKVLDDSSDCANTQIGTPYFLSPEICESKPYGKKSDIWSMGCVLYELLALQVPFRAQSLPALIRKIILEPPPPIPEEYSEGIGGIIRRMLTKDPDRRPTVKKVLCSELIQSHIQWQLSYTIQTGSGGAEAYAQDSGAAPPAANLQQMHDAALAHRNSNSSEPRDEHNDNDTEGGNDRAGTTADGDEAVDDDDDDDYDDNDGQTVQRQQEIRRNRQGRAQSNAKNALLRRAGKQPPSTPTTAAAAQGMIGRKVTVDREDEGDNIAPAAGADSDSGNGLSDEGDRRRGRHDDRSSGSRSRSRSRSNAQPRSPSRSRSRSRSRSHTPGSDLDETVEAGSHHRHGRAAQRGNVSVDEGDQPDVEVLDERNYDLYTTDDTKHSENARAVPHARAADAKYTSYDAEEEHSVGDADVTLVAGVQQQHARRSPPHTPPDDTVQSDLASQTGSSASTAAGGGERRGQSPRTPVSLSQYYNPDDPSQLAAQRREATRQRYLRQQQQQRAAHQHQHGPGDTDQTSSTDGSGGGGHPGHFEYHSRRAGGVDPVQEERARVYQENRAQYERNRNRLKPGHLGGEPHHGARDAASDFKRNFDEDSSFQGRAGHHQYQQQQRHGFGRDGAVVHYRHGDAKRTVDSYGSNANSAASQDFLRREYQERHRIAQASKLRAEAERNAPNPMFGGMEDEAASKYESSEGTVATADVKHVRESLDEQRRREEEAYKQELEEIHAQNRAIQARARAAAAATAAAPDQEELQDSFGRPSADGDDMKTQESDAARAQLELEREEQRREELSRAASDNYRENRSRRDQGQVGGVAFVINFDDDAADAGAPRRSSRPGKSGRSKSKSTPSSASTHRRGSRADDEDTLPAVNARHSREGGGNAAERELEDGYADQNEEGAVVEHEGGGASGRGGRRKTRGRWEPPLEMPRLKSRGSEDVKQDDDNDASVLDVVPPEARRSKSSRERGARAARKMVSRRRSFREEARNPVRQQAIPKLRAFKHQQRAALAASSKRNRAPPEGGDDTRGDKALGPVSAVIQADGGLVDDTEHLPVVSQAGRGRGIASVAARHEAVDVESGPGMDTQITNAVQQAQQVQELVSGLRGVGAGVGTGAAGVRSSRARGSGPDEDQDHGGQKHPESDDEAEDTLGLSTMDTGGVRMYETEDGVDDGVASDAAAAAAAVGPRAAAAVEAVSGSGATMDSSATVEEEEDLTDLQCNLVNALQHAVGDDDIVEDGLDAGDFSEDDEEEDEPDDEDDGIVDESGSSGLSLHATQAAELASANWDAQGVAGLDEAAVVADGEGSAIVADMDDYSYEGDGDFVDEQVGVRL